MSGGLKRRLAAIIGADEAGTLEALRASRSEIFDPKIEEQDDRIDKPMGDGLLLEFPSVVEAALCAVEIQNELARRNAEELGGRYLVEDAALRT